MAKRFMCMIMTFLLLVLIAGCSKPKEKPPNLNTEADTAPDESKLDAVDFGGEKITFMTFGYDTTELSSQIDLEGRNDGSYVELGIYKRNLAVCDKYNVEFQSIQVNRHQIFENVATYRLSGDDIIDICLISTAPAIDCAVSGYLRDINQIPYLNFSESYWYDDYYKETELNGQNFFILGDINYLAWTMSYCMYFNSTLASTWDIDAEEIYTLVRDGEWTFERLIEYSKNVYDDSDRNGFRSEYDTYGFFSNSSCVDALLAGSDIRFITTTDDGLLKIAAPDRFYDFYDLMLQLAHADSSLYSDTGAFASIDRLNFPNAFFANRALFYCASLPAQNSELRNVAFEYVFLPLPKWDCTQSQYYSWLHQYNCSSVAFIDGGQDMDMLGRIAEDMAFYSKKYVRTAYYDELLEGIIASSPIFIEMLDYFIGIYSIDLTSLFGEQISLLSGGEGLIRTSVNNNASITGTMARNLPKCQELLDSIMKKMNPEGETK